MRKTTFLFWVTWVTCAPCGAYTLSDYVQDCRNAGIELPDNLNCEDGVEVPIRKTFCDKGKPETFSIYSKDFKRNVPGRKITFEQALKTGCDNPVHLNHSVPDEGRCIPGSKIQYKQIGDTSCVFFCRRYHWPEPGKQTYYQDINMICYQEKTGGTCFFNSPPKDDTEGTRFRTPATHGEERWMGPEGFYKNGKLLITRCTQCHDAGPFIVTPYVGAAGVVPTDNAGYDTADQQPPHRDLKGSYWVVGEGKPFSESLWRRRYELIAHKGRPSEVIGTCTRCHRIGPEATCGYLMDWSVTHDKAVVTGFNEDCPDLHPQWMPPHAKTVGPRAEQAIRFIRHCCEDRAKLVEHQLYSFLDEYASKPKPSLDPECEWRPIADGRSTSGHSPSKDAKTH